MELGPDGIKEAARRRALYEFNLATSISNLEVVQRIIYSRPMDHYLLGEHELDYCIISRDELSFEMNENEIEDFLWLDRTDLDIFMKESDVTPWFYLIYESGLLSLWWDQLNDLPSVQSSEIIRLS